MTWREAVLAALRRYSLRHSTRKIERQVFINEELAPIVSDTSSAGATPAQTLNRVLQELRDEGILYFLGHGIYLLADSPVLVDSEHLPDDALNFLAARNLLSIGSLPTDNREYIARRRIGQSKLREVTLENYHHRCAFCDVDDSNLLIASHISRWTDDPAGRGDLSNIICMCRFHDALFEFGYFSLTDNYHVLRRRQISSRVIIGLLPESMVFNRPVKYAPTEKYLRKHRLRFGFV